MNTDNTAHSEGSEPKEGFDISKGTDISQEDYHEKVIENLQNELQFLRDQLTEAGEIISRHIKSSVVAADNAKELRDQLASERKKNEDLERHIERIVFEFCEYSGIGKISGYYHKPFSSPPALTDRWKDFKIDKAKNLLK